jgi:hypothetical protein
MSLTNNETQMITKTINNVLQISFEKDIIIDPCAGNGSMIEAIDSLTQFTFYYQAYSRQQSESLLHKKIDPIDFLTIDYQQFDKTVLAGLWYNKVHVISCPAESEITHFLNKCSEFADTISFILPKNYLSPILSNYHLSLYVEINNDYILKVWERKPNVN